MWKRFKINGRLFIGFGLLILFLVAAGIYSVFQLNHLAQLTTELHDHPLTVSTAVHRIDTNIVKMHRSMKDVAMARDEAKLQVAVALVNRFEKEILDDLLVTVKDRFKGDKSEVDRMRESIRNWKVIRDEVIALTTKGLKEEKDNPGVKSASLVQAAEITKGKGALYVMKLETELEGFVKFAHKMADSFMAKADEEKMKTFIITGIIILFALVFSIFISLSITKSIVRPLNQAVSVAEHLADGDISISIEVENSDETGLLLKAMKNMVENLRKQLKEMAEVATVLAGSSRQIFATTTEFAASFAEIASSLSETVAGMKEVRQTSELSNEKAKAVSERSQDVVQVSQKGESSVNATISSMNGIQEQMLSIAESIVSLSEQNQSIGDIIGVVDDIAEQSRLLAVNASIEAVKAGEQGKGFSVVAGEIKNLALQSKQSTNQVRSILKDIQKATGKSVMVTEKGTKTVESGVNLARQTGEAIKFLGENIVESSKATVQIEVTSRQQLAGIDQIFTAMENINTAISQNSSGARELETATRNLEELGQKMKTILDNYTL
ncbi:MAG: methyl-accepting chemotaxis protein [bacterium]|nr:methyl-accepting chemotaxis protein [bacterium]